MADRQFEDSLRFLKSLVNELANPVPRNQGGSPRRFRPEAAERFHRGLKNTKDKMADEIAEQNMTPNMVLDNQMSINPLSDFRFPSEEDEEVPIPMQFGHMVSDRQKWDGVSPPVRPVPKSFAELQRTRYFYDKPHGPLPYEQIRQFPNDPTNPFKLKSSPFDSAWKILKGE